MRKYRGTSWQRETAAPLPFSGSVMPMLASAPWFKDRTVHHGFRIALRRSSLVTNDPLDTCPGAGEAMSFPSLATGICPHHHAE